MGEVTKLMTVKEVLIATGYKSRTTLWRRVRSGQFPKPIALSTHATRWKKTDVDAWINELPEVHYGTEMPFN